MKQENPAVRLGTPGFGRGEKVNRRSWPKGQPRRRPRWPQKVRSDQTCSIDGCGRPVQARGWCNVHYHRHRKYGTTNDPRPNYTQCMEEGCERPTRNRSNPRCGLHHDRLHRKRTSRPAEPKPPRNCGAPDCDLRAERRGYCRKHHYRLETHGTFDLPPRGDRTVDPEIRFAKSTRWGEPSDFAPHLGPCLIYLGADNGNGYGQFRYNGGNGYAHRYAWERVHGPIPDGLTVDHLCRVRSCVNAEHMELVDGPTNTRRGAASRTHCPNNHEYNATNTKFIGHRRICTVCVREGQRKSWRRRHPEKPHPNIKFDQTLVRSVIASIRRAETTIAQGAREIGCNPNYLGRRVWQETKKDVFARDKGCVLCGSAENLDAHHRRARGSGGSSDPATSFGLANLVTLCRSHHQQIETNPDWARTKGLRLDNGQVPAETPIVSGLHGYVLLDDHGSIRPAGGAA